MAGKTVAITGASSGIGLEVARGLAALGARVVPIVRDRTRMQTAMPALDDRDIVTADLYSMGDVKRAAADVRGRLPRLDVLVHNAGAQHGQRELTVDGFEKTFALDVLAPFLLTFELRELLAASAPARVITTASSVHRMASVRWSGLATMEPWPGPLAAYAACKLCGIWFAREAARRFAPAQVTSNALHPGVIGTGFGRTGTRLFRILYAIARPFMKSPKRGARASIKLASDPALAGATGLYFNPRGNPTTPSKGARDDAAARRLWTYAEERCGVRW